MKEPDMPEAEHEVRVLLAAAVADVPPGIDLVRGVQARRAAHRIHLRVALSAAAAAVAAAAAAITLTFIQATPSALAQLTSAVSRTAGQSYYFSETTTVVTLPGDGTPRSARTGLRGAFDPARRIGEETTSTGVRLRFIGSYLYLNSRPAAGQPPLPPGVSWLEYPSSLLWVPATASRQLRLTAGIFSVAGTSPQTLLTLLESVSKVNRQGSVSGPGWTGTRYAFSVTIALGQAGSGQGTARATGTIDVDPQGEVRRLDAAYTVTPIYKGPVLPSAPPERGTVEMTFSDFGAHVSVSAPPAREVFNPHSAPVVPGIPGGQ
jgi:hypothetical protein